jgi:hypothetical protein
VASGVAAFTLAPRPAGQIGVATSSDALSAPSQSTTLRVAGLIEKYDASSRMLSLTTSTGTMQFPVASPVRIRLRGRQIDAAALENLSGYRAVVRYSEARGNKTVDSISVLDKPKG